jgi:hypothetical protein
VVASYASRITSDATVAESLDGLELPDTSCLGLCCYNQVPTTWASESQFISLVLFPTPISSETPAPFLQTILTKLDAVPRSTC